MAVALSDPSGNVSAGAPLTVTATLRDSGGAPIPGAVLSFTSGDTSLATLSPASALTGADGKASATLNATGPNASGASYVTVSFQDPNNSSMAAQGSIGFQVNAATVALNVSTTPSPANISAYGTASISASVTVNGTAPSIPVTVNFSSICQAAGKASLPASAQTVNGAATVTYTDKGCGQTDTVTVSEGGVQRTVNIGIAAPQAVSIQFVSTDHPLLVIKGTGAVGYFESAVVTFKVVDQNNNPVAGQTVNLGLTTTTGGITLNGVSLSPGATLAETTAADGTVSVSVQSGTVPTSVWVTATMGSLATQSNKVTISTGRPTQKFLSLAATKHAMDGWDFDGDVSTLTVHASDRLGTPVPDGTTINFVTSGGQLVGDNNQQATSSTCATANGVCSVKLVSANFRPTPPAATTPGRVVVLAYALGEESFNDLNGNNIFDSGEPWDDLGDTCIDANQNGICDAGEQRITYSTSNNHSCPSASIFNNASLLNWPNSCDGHWGNAFVRESQSFIFSGNTPFLSPNPDFARIGSFGYSPVLTDTITFNGTDYHNNPMPTGTKLAILATQTSLTDQRCPAGSTDPFCIGYVPCASTQKPTVSVFPDTLADQGADTPLPFGTPISIFVQAPPGCEAARFVGNVALTTTTPTSNVTTLINFFIQ